MIVLFHKHLKQAVILSTFSCSGNGEFQDLMLTEDSHTPDDESPIIKKFFGDYQVLEKG
jgi:hypothetical protein